jgi:acyl-CoA thioester hydrolase
MSLDGCTFRYPLTVYYEDTDFSGLVYHANYLRFFERARTHAMIEKQVDLKRLYHNLGWHFVLSSLSVTYKKPAQFLDRLCVVSETRLRGRTQIDWHQRLVDPQDDALYCAMDAHLILVDDKMRPKRLPSLDDLRHAIDSSSRA